MDALAPGYLHTKKQGAGDSSSPILANIVANGPVPGAESGPVEIFRA